MFIQFIHSLIVRFDDYVSGPYRYAQRRYSTPTGIGRGNSSQVIIMFMNVNDVSCPSEDLNFNVLRIELN